LAESDHLRFAVGSDPIVRPPRPSAPIRKRLVNRCERATPELVQIAAANVILRGHLGYMLSPEQRSAEHDAVDAVHTDAAAVHMVLQLGYFKAKRQFFNFYRFGALGIFYQYLLPAAVIKFGGPAVGVASDSLSGFKSAVIFQKIRACRPE